MSCSAGMSNLRLNSIRSYGRNVQDVMRRLVLTLMARFPEAKSKKLEPPVQVMRSLHITSSLSFSAITPVLGVDHTPHKQGTGTGDPDGGQPTDCGIRANLEWVDHIFKMDQPVLVVTPVSKARPPTPRPGIQTPENRIDQIYSILDRLW